MALEYVKFYRGDSSLYDPAVTHKDGIYFATDTKELYMNGDTYGGGGGSQSITITYDAPDTLVFTSGEETTTIKLQEAAAGTSAADSLGGLISAEDIYKLATVLSDSKAYTDELITALEETLTAVINTEENRAEDRENELAEEITKASSAATAAQSTAGEALALAQDIDLSDYAKTTYVDSSIEEAVKDVVHSTTATTLWTGTEEEYNALSSYSNSTLYIITK